MCNGNYIPSYKSPTYDYVVKSAAWLSRISASFFEYA